MKLESYNLGLLHHISGRALTSPPMPCPILCGLRFLWVCPEDAIGYGLAGSASLVLPRLSPTPQPGDGEGHFHLGCSGSSLQKVLPCI